ncbi:Beta sliding clamp [bioreactor metagenome]|jgi:DNA polymerase-3 subunit beta|uniref:Beta sliding clamp n=1 Tax=bioreactor metagenome TaxID=1076179 RepID=A0A644UZT0_9ZZZZ|nr:DNA polymerase III subunit beta [Paludibacter sp.]
MKFKASSTILLSHLQAISRVINSKNSLQILDNFLFSLEGQQLTMTASDTETTLITSMEVEDVEGAGKVAVSSRLLLDTLREFSDQPLNFQINDSNLAMVITSANGTYNFIGQNGDEYPRLPELQADAKMMTLPVNTLSAGISKTLFCTADDELRPVMNGIYFDILKDSLTLVATDAHKLVRYKTSYTSVNLSEEDKASFILPKKPANMLKNILPKESGEVEVKFDNKNAYFKLSNYTMICRQVEGRYPNYNGVIPKENPYKIIVDRVSLLNALKRVSVFSNQASNLIKLQISENQIFISAQDIDFSISAEETINCQYADDQIKIGFKSAFLIEILNNINSSDVIVELTDPSRAGIILPFENEDNEDILMLLMPMLLND